MKFRNPLLTLLFCFFLTPLISQKSDEVGVFIGCSFYNGDLNPNGFFNEFTKMAAGAVYRRNLNTRFSERINLFIGTLYANDAQSPYAFNQERNLNFKSPVDEVSGVMEFNFLDFDMSSKKYFYTPYLFGGIGLFRFNPQGWVNGQWVALQPLGTEGQGTTGNPKPPYSLIQPCIPFGFGLKVSIAQTICLNFEWGLRKTFTGYLDDVSTTYPDPIALIATRGANGPLAVAASNKSLNPNKTGMIGTQRGDGNNDWYSFAGLIITWRIHNQKNVCYSYD
jgi:hypothetical protein